MPDPGYPYHYGNYVTADGGTERLPCKHCRPGFPCAEARGVFDPVPGTDATMFIQWKGTDLCIDFHCPCQPDEIKFSAHFDGYFAHALRCPACGSVYELGTQVRARLIDFDPEGRINVEDLDLDRPGAVVPSTRPPGPVVPPPVLPGDLETPFPAVTERAVAGLLLRLYAAAGYEGVGPEADPSGLGTPAVDALVLAWARERRPDLTPGVFGLPEGSW